MEVIVPDVKPDIGDIPGDKKVIYSGEDQQQVMTGRGDSKQIVLTPGGSGGTLGTISTGSGINNNTIKILTQSQTKSGGTIYITGGTGGGVLTSSSPVRTSTIHKTTTSIIGDQQSNQIIPKLSPGSPSSSGLNIVHVTTLPQSVIQAPSSVIQTASGQIQLGSSKNVILLKSGGGLGSGSGSSVIQTVGGGLQTIQLLDTSQHLHSDESLSNDDIEHHPPSSTVSRLSDRGNTPGDRNRREILTRRPSYRKILNDLGGAEITGGDRGESSATSESSQDGLDGTGNIVIGGQPYPVKVINSSTLGLGNISGADATNGSATSLQTITMTNPGSGGTIVQYTHPDGQPFYVPVGADLQTYTLRPIPSNPNQSSVVVHGNSGGGGNGGNSHHHVPEEATRKREIRLLKNREAARECRRKKKEYIKCLENRVAVLENQNKALIDELKSLKELYCQQKVD